MNPLAWTLFFLILTAAVADILAHLAECNKE
jgi:hypothetical protein